MTIVLHLPIPTGWLLTSNQRLHWRAKAERTDWIRADAYLRARAFKFEKLPPATCEVEVTWPDNRRRDAHNVQPTVKAAIDGMVDAGLLKDDSDQFLMGLTFIASPVRVRTPGIAAHLKFTFTPVTP